MSLGDYVLDSLLVLLVLRQVRESRLDLRAILLPLGIAAVVCQSYLHSIPTTGHDLELIVPFAAIGVALGLISGFATRIRFDGKHALVKAGWIAAGTWVLGMGFRMAFSIWANTSAGESALVRFSISHHITGGDAWTAALVLMAMAEVVVRTVVLVARSRRTATNGPAKQLTLV